jgi:hypothetical protein
MLLVGHIPKGSSSKLSYIENKIYFTAPRSTYFFVTIFLPLGADNLSRDKNGLERVVFITD